MKRFVEVVFNTMLTLALLAMLSLFWFGFKGSGAEVPADNPSVTSEAVAAEGELPQSGKRSHPGVPFTQGNLEEVTVVDCVVIEEPKPIYTEEELDMLALVIYQEAGSDACSDKVRMMVGNVVLNRVADDRFPDTMEDVLTEVSTLGYGAYGRLHWTGLVWPERASLPSEAHAVQRAYDCAERLLNGERVFADDVVWQAEFAQGTEVVDRVGGFYFCR